jgi:hypothetical protein
MMSTAEAGLDGGGHGGAHALNEGSGHRTRMDWTVVSSSPQEVETQLGHIAKPG